MNYQRIYDSIIEKRKVNIPIGYKERHHIIPRSFGGTNKKENLVYLTAREHFICHYLLIKIHTSGPKHHKAIHAFMMMNVTCSDHQRITSRLFEKYRIEFSLIMSELQGGENNSQYGKIWITNGEEERKVPKENVIPEGWIPGRKDKVREDAKLQIPWNRGRKLSDEEKQHLNNTRKSRKGNKDFKVSEETKNKISSTLMGHKHSEETKKKISDSHKGKKRQVSNSTKEDKTTPMTIYSNICQFCGKVFEHNTKTKFCHQDCKNNSQKGSSLDEFVDQFIESFKETGSINKSLKSIGKCGSGGYYKWAVNVLDSRNIERQRKILL